MYTHFIGRIGKDGAKVIEGKNGSFMTVDVATDAYIKGENKTMWVRVRSGKSNHVKLAQYLTKGKLILVEGSQTEPDTWVGSDGQPHAQVVIVADAINFIRTGRGQAQGEGGQQTQSPVSTQPEITVETKEEQAPFPAPADNSDDLPF